MLSITFLGILGLFSTVLSEQRLLVDQLRWEFLEMENELWNLSANGLLYKEQADSELYLVKNFHDFDQKLKQMPEEILRGLEPLRTIPDFLFLYSELTVIKQKYEKFREYQSTHISKSRDKFMIEDIIYDITNNKTGVKKSIEYVYDLTFDQQGNIVEELIKMMSDNFWCKNFQQSPQQLYYNLYNVISLIELKAYIMQQFAYLGNRLWDKGNNVELSITDRKNYAKRTISTMTRLSLIKLYPKDIWRCDPKIYIKGKSYDEFTRFLQGHIQNEVDMSSQRTCKNTCSEYSYTRSYGCYDYESEFCRKVERCSGTLIGCFFVESDGNICVSNVPSRRYDYIKYSSGRTFGKKHICGIQKSVSSWTRWFVHCSYCMCLCDEHGPRSDRYINLRPVHADVKNNRVVTGLRLVKHNRILHIQIQEGKMLPYGFVNESTVHWVPVDNYKITDYGVKSGEDFFTLTYQHRSMALDEIQVNEDNHVVTGVRFEVINNRVHFEIFVSPFNWHNGTVYQNNGYYIYETNPSGRSRISLSNADIPIMTSKPSDIHFSGTKSEVEFTHTDFNKDAAQTTIPYIDTQEVINKPAVPLMGAGIYYKGIAGYGGFIAPRIKTYDFGKHIDPSVPKMSVRVDISDSVEIN